jgi:hypothetical protein
VRTTETVCPFCAGPVANRLVPKTRAPLSTRGLSRAGILALGASVSALAAGAAGVLLEGCADEPEPEDPGNQVPVYGAPVPPGTPGGGGNGDAGAPRDASYPDASGFIDAGSGVAIYGAPIQPARDAGVPSCDLPVPPVQDAGKPDSGRFDAGSVVAVYGAPIQPRPDAGAPEAGTPEAGTPEAGRIVPVYGAPIIICAPVQPTLDPAKD